MTALWQTQPTLTDPLEDRRALHDQIGDRVEGTCQWLLHDPVFSGWAEKHSALLWISGGPGKGKTVLSIYIAELLEKKVSVSKNTNDLFLQYFCDSKDDRRNSAVSILRALIYQAIQQQPNLVQHLESVFSLQKDGLFRTAQLGSLWSCFASMLMDDTIGDIYCVLDGLDECEPSSLRTLLKRLRALYKREGISPTRLCLVALSRNRPEFIARELSGFDRLNLDEGHVSQYIRLDVERFIAQKVHELAEIWEYPPSLRDRVSHSLKVGSTDTFLWAGIVARELEDSSPDQVLQVLEKCPPGLEVLYGRMVSQIPADQRQTSQNILRWVALASRPLTLTELGTAIELEETACTAGLPLARMTSEKVKHCGQLLVIRGKQESQTVHMVHQSVKDYLLQQTSTASFTDTLDPMDLGEASIGITRRCLQYLQQQLPGLGPIDMKTPSRVLSSSPLLGYAGLHWMDHASNVLHVDADIFDSESSFFAADSQARKIWIESHNMTYSDRRMKTTCPLLHIAARFDLLALAFKLLRDSGSRMPRNDRSLALEWATRENHTEMVELLLGLNMTANLISPAGSQVPIALAAKNGNLEVVRLLLHAGANPDDRDQIGGTPLMGAAYYGHVDVMQELVSFEADWDAFDDFGRNALHSAAVNMQTEAVRLLLEETNIDIDLQDAHGNTALHEAARSGSLGCVKLLLRYGARSDLVNQRGRTPTDNVNRCRAIQSTKLRSFWQDYHGLTSTSESQGHVTRRGRSP